MNVLQERIKKEGKVLPGNIIKVDGFLNHRVDVKLMREMAKEFGRLFDLTGITAVLTVEASGIALATICAEEFGVPMIFAKKAKSDNIEGGLYKSEIFSYTYKKKVTLLMSKQWLGPNDKVLIIDDFLANGEALHGLVVCRFKYLVALVIVALNTTHENALTHGEVAQKPQTRIEDGSIAHYF